MTARIFIFIAMLIGQVYRLALAHAADVQRKKPLPEEVADVYDADRYQTFLEYTADRKKLRNKFKIVNLAIECLLIFSPVYGYIEKLCSGNAYGVFFVTFGIVWLIELVIDVWADYEVTFHLLEKYGMNKKDRREFVKDEILEQSLELVVMVAFMSVVIYVGEHLAGWTNNFSIGLLKSLLLCGIVGVVGALVLAVLQLISYGVLRKQYTFTPMEDGELKDKINKLQESSKRKVKHIYVYNESKKTTTKNAFLLKLFWHKEFGIADNFMNENAEEELLAVLSHEVGHLKHRKDFWNFIDYGIKALLAAAVVAIVADPSVCLWMNDWIRRSFDITINNYYLTFTVYSYIVSPIFWLYGIFGSYKSKKEEYEADREAVANGYGEALIKTFKSLSSDELVDVNPHPFIEFTEYDHPGMYRRIKAIQEAASADQNSII